MEKKLLKKMIGVAGLVTSLYYSSNALSDSLNNIPSFTQKMIGGAPHYVFTEGGKYKTILEDEGGNKFYRYANYIEVSGNDSSRNGLALESYVIPENVRVYFLAHCEESLRDSIAPHICPSKLDNLITRNLLEQGFVETEGNCSSYGGFYREFINPRTEMGRQYLACKKLNEN